jgi:hypothetical protein
MSKKALREHLLLSILFLGVLLIFFTVALSGLVTDIHSHNLFLKIFSPALLLLLFLVIVHRIFVIFWDIKLIFFPQKSIFVDGSVAASKFTESLKTSLIARGWNILDHENGADLKVNLCISFITKAECGILCHLEDWRGRETTFQFSDIFWPEPATICILEFSRSNKR